MSRRSTTSPEEAAALQAAGARLLRHAHDMMLDLPAGDGWSEPRLADGLALRSGTAPVPDLVRVRLAAYPPGHPDAGHEGRTAEEHERELAGLLAGQVTGPVLEDASGVVVDAAGDLVGAVVVTHVGPQAWGWTGGAWVADVLVDPRWQGHGLGRALLQRAIARCTAAGRPCIGLTVTEGNPAERLYRALGFERRRTLYVLEV